MQDHTLRVSRRMVGRLLLGIALVAALNSCAVDRALNASDEARTRGDYVAAVQVLRQQLRESPDDIRLQTALHGALERLTSYYSQQADRALRDGNDDEAVADLRVITENDPANIAARNAIAEIQARTRLQPLLQQARAMQATDPRGALRLVRQVLAEQPNYYEAVQLRDALSGKLERADTVTPKVSDALRRPVSLNFNSQPLSNIFDAIHKMTGINFVFDRDVNQQAAASISATRTTAEDAINLLLASQQLGKKMLDPKTFMIYPARAEKDRIYRDLVVRTFFLSYADPKQVAAYIKQMFKPREVLVDERLSAVIVRDGLDTIGPIENMVQTLDLPQSEVTMDVTALEVSRNDLRNLGIEYPGAIGVSAGNGGEGGGGDGEDGGALNNAGGTTPLNNLLNLRRSDIRVTSPALTLNMLESSGNTEMLANPRVRVKNREKATVTIGERVPVVTTTSINGVGTTESINYQDVGLKLEIEPIISLHDEIDIKVSMDVSNVIREEKTKTGLIAYVIGTRNIETTLSSRNNEMQIIGGLIRRLDFDRKSGLPWVSRIPILGQYFFGSRNRSNENSEIVLLIRPRIERNLELPASQVSTFMSGTEARPGDESLQLRNSENVNVGAPAGGAAAGGATPPPPAEQPNANWQPLPPPVTNEPANAASAPETPQEPASAASVAAPANSSQARSGRRGG